MFQPAPFWPSVLPSVLQFLTTGLLRPLPTTPGIDRGQPDLVVHKAGDHYQMTGQILGYKSTLVTIILYVL